MKFHRIDIKNINSLFGDNPIDIDGEFADTALFLIMGPTGSGKTTILDAVCLALFGTTPRQEDAAGGAAGVGAQVNSRGTGRSRARVVFSLLDPAQGHRTRYRATWEFWRAHQKPYATPQKPRRELERLDDGHWQPIVSSTKEKEYQAAFSRILDDMTLQDFLKSVMLAQGDFSALLEADDAGKASILERLTDTADYRQLGRLAHERWQRERDQLASLQQRIDNFDGASPERIAALEDAIDDNEHTCAMLARWKDAAARRKSWLERHRRLKHDRAVAEKAREDAAARQEDHADDFDRRDADRRAGAARDSLKEMRRLDDDIESLDANLPKLEQAKTEQTRALEKSRQAEEAASDEYERAEEALEAVKPEIDRAKQIKGDLKNARQHVDALDAKSTDQKEALDEAKSKLDEAKQTLDEASSAQNQAADTFETLADDRGLAEQLPALRAQYRSLQKDGVQLERAAHKVADCGEAVAETSTKRQEVDEKLQAQREAIAPLKQAAEAARATLVEQLGEATRPRERYDDISQALQATKRRKESLRQLDVLVDTLADQRDKRDDLKARCDQVVARRSELADVIEALKRTRDDLQQTVDAYRKDIDQLDQNLLASRLRRTLEHGDACPVCGGKDHPKIASYGAAALDEHERRDRDARDRLAAEVEDAERRRDELDEQLRARADGDDELAAGLTRLETKVEAADNELDRLEEAASTVAGEVGGPTADLDFGAEASDDALANAEALLDDKIAAFEQQKSALADAQDAVAAADEQLEEANDGIESLDDQHKDLQRTFQNQRDNKQAAADEHERLRREFGAARQRLADCFEQAGVDLHQDSTQQDEQGEQEGTQQDDAPDFAAALQAADERLDAYKAARAASKRADEARAEADKAHTRASSEHDHARQSLETTSGELDDARKLVESLQEKLVSKLDGNDPADVEKHHADTIQAACKRRDERSKARQEADKAAQKASDDLDRARERRKTLKQKRQTVSQKLDETIAGIVGMSTVVEVAEALLDDDERERLAKLCGDIETTLRDARRDIERLDADLAEHDQDRPEDFAPEVYSLETLQACQRQLDDAIGAYNTRIGALEEKLGQMRERLDAYRELLAERRAQKEEHDVWKELNDIIGLRDGERFKQFAQALNLDRIVDRANRRLEELHPRYRLQTKHDPASGLPTLDFEIVDTYHAGKPRDLSTLSGGETFLVSLALALALADHQQIDMPIETLFLDEGFGTLDRDSLRKAIDILNDLHTRAGRTVGVISHVQALQGRIPNQIIVKPEQEGRSSVILKG